MSAGVSLLYLARIASQYDAMSLDASIPGADADDDAPTWADRLADARPLPDAELDAARRRALIGRGLRALTVRNAMIVALRLAGWSAEDIAPVIGVSRSRVRAVEAMCHERMRQAIAGGAGGAR